jgi:hypothetical protein
VIPTVEPHKPNAEDQAVPKVPPHLALGCVSREFLDIISTHSRLLDIDATDILIVACVAVLSTRDALKDPFAIAEYDGGRRALPLNYCRGVYTKEVSYTLNLNGETTRRRLATLVTKGYLIKEGRQFFMPLQEGETDFTDNARKMAVSAIQRLHEVQQRYNT